MNHTEHPDLRPITPADLPELIHHSTSTARALRNDPRLMKVAPGYWAFRPDGTRPSWERQRHLTLARIRATALRLQAQYTFCGPAAALIWGLVDSQESRIDIAHPQSRGSSAMGYLRHRLIQYRADQITEVAGIPVTNLRQTLIDCAHWLPVHNSLPVVDQALRFEARVSRFEAPSHRRMRNVQQEIIKGLKQRAGVRRARFVVPFANGLSESPGESRLRLLTHLIGLPIPVVQWERWVDGCQYFCDLAWPDIGSGVAVEFDGLAKYSTSKDALVAEKSREIALASAGVRVIRFTSGQLDHHSIATRSLIHTFTQMGVQLRPRGLTALR